MSVTLSEVKRAARAHRAPLAGESAGYLVLALADQVLSAPRLIEASDIQLTDDGGLRVLGGQASSEGDAELSLRRALDGLLLVASSGSAALSRAGRRESPVGLPALVRELEAALIPVNRAAARRALARLHRETARAVASGVLPDEQPEVRAVHERAPLPPAMPRATAPELDELETCAISVPVPAPAAIDLPPALSSLDGVVSALCEEPEAPFEESPSDHALTRVLVVGPASTAEESILCEEDVEFIDEEPSDALTVARNLDVMQIDSDLVDLPAEACTRPEPIVLRQALRTQARPELSASVVEPLPRTPTLGSLAAELPVLAPEQIAEMTRREQDTAERAPFAPAADAVVSSVPNDDFTEPMPAVAALSSSLPIVASRKSDVSELLAGFSVGSGEPGASDETHEGLRRAIKELAELDLTPAPFAALIR